VNSRSKSAIRLQRFGEEKHDDRKTCRRSVSEVGDFWRSLLHAGVAPVSAQVQEAAQPQQSQQGQSAAATASSGPESGAGTRSLPVPGAAKPLPPTTYPRETLSATKGRDYSKGQPWFPEFWKPYQPLTLPEPMLTNAPTIEQLIRDGKLMLSLDDAISIALENN